MGRDRPQPGPKRLQHGRAHLMRGVGNLIGSPGASIVQIQSMTGKLFLYDAWPGLEGSAPDPGLPSIGPRSPASRSGYCLFRPRFFGVSACEQNRVELKPPGAQLSVSLAEPVWNDRARKWTRWTALSNDIEWNGTAGRAWAAALFQTGDSARLWAQCRMPSMSMYPRQL